MKQKIFILVLIFIFSVFYSCKDRIFNNPFDPDPVEPGYEIVSIITIGNLIPVDMTFAGDSIWIIDMNSRIFSLNHNSGAIIRELEFPYSNHVNGICYTGSDLWLNIEENYEIVKVNIINGSVIKHLNLVEGIYSAMDFFNLSIYILDELSSSIIQVNPDTGETITSVRSPSFSTDGICFDGEHLWILDSSSLRIYKLKADGEIVQVYRTPDKNPVGLCYNQGIIWCGDKSGKIFKLRFQ